MGGTLRDSRRRRRPQRRLAGEPTRNETVDATSIRGAYWQFIAEAIML